MKNNIKEWFNRKRLKDLVSYDDFIKGINVDEKHINKYFRMLNKIKLEYLTNEEMKIICETLFDNNLIKISNVDTGVFKNAYKNEDECKDNLTYKYLSILEVKMKNTVENHDKKIKKYIKSFISKNNTEKEKFILLKEMMSKYPTNSLNRFHLVFVNSFNDEFYGQQSSKEKEILSHYLSPENNKIRKKRL